jgi:hypothetical protein
VTRWAALVRVVPRPSTVDIACFPGMGIESMADTTVAVKSRYVTKHAPKTPSNLKRIESIQLWTM